MKKDNKSFTLFNIRINQEDRYVITTLQKKYSINISGFFKNTMKEKLKKLESENDHQ